jgi:hypothetical protein
MALYDITAGGESTIINSAVSFSATKACQLANDKVVITYVRSTTLYAKVGTLSGTTWTWGTEATIATGVSNYPPAICKVATDKFAIAYAVNTYDPALAVVCSVSTTTITVGTAAAYASQDSKSVDCCYISDDKVAFVAANDGDNGGSTIRVATVSTRTLSFGTASTAISTAKIRDYTLKIALIDTDKLITTFSTVSGLQNRCYTCVGGTTLTVGTVATVTATSTYYASGIIKASTGKFIGVTTNNNAQIYLWTGSVSGTDITNGNLASLDTSYGVTNGNITTGYSEDTFVIVAQGSGGTPKLLGSGGKMVSNTITIGTVVELNGGNTTGATTVCPVNLSSQSASRFLTAYRNETDSYGNAQIFDVDFGSSGSSKFFQLF